MSQASKIDPQMESSELPRKAESDTSKYPRHILKKPIVATTRKNTVTLMQQVMDEMAAKSTMLHVEDVESARVALESQPQSLLFVDWNLGPEIASQILKAGRSIEGNLNLRPIILLIPNVTSELVAIAMEYCVTKVVAGQLMAPSLKEQIENVRRIMDSEQGISRKLELIAEARKSNDQKFVSETIADLHQQYPNDLRLIVEYAEHLIETGEWVQAEVLLHPLWNREPPYLRALSAYSRCLLKKGATGDAESVLKNAKIINPYDVDRLIELGEVMLMNGKTDEAKENFSDAIQLDRSNKDAKFGKAKCQLVQDDINDALNLVQEVATPRELASIFNMAAVIATRDKKFEHSVKLYETATGLVSNNPWLKARLAFNQGLALYKWEKPEEARIQFDRATKEDPKYTKASRFMAALDQAIISGASTDELADSEESFSPAQKRILKKRSS